MCLLQLYHFLSKVGSNYLVLSQQFAAQPVYVCLLSMLFSFEWISQTHSVHLWNRTCVRSQVCVFTVRVNTCTWMLDTLCVPTVSCPRADICPALSDSPFTVLGSAPSRSATTPTIWRSTLHSGQLQNGLQLRCKAGLPATRLLHCGREHRLKGNQKLLQLLQVSKGSFSFKSSIMICKFCFSLY